MTEDSAHTMYNWNLFITVEQRTMTFVRGIDQNIVQFVAPIEQLTRRDGAVTWRASLILNPILDSRIRGGRNGDTC